MRNIITGISFILIMIHSVNAQTITESEKQRPLSDFELGQMYLKKSKDQKTASWILLGTGVTLNLIGAFIVPNDLESTEKLQSSQTGAALFIVGSVSALMSVPLFISGEKYKARADILLSEREIPISFEKGRNISLSSFGIGISLSKRKNKK